MRDIKWSYLSLLKDKTFGRFSQDLPLLQLFEGLKMGVFLHKNAKFSIMAFHV